ncbi:MAG TPA: tRNA (adenine-N1)-methyltransferase [Candidatus Bathyarchaeota archaeon]|nr:tRNA (adenine-N1)-methyltransferase [Candidatus Bathyarchaeota archaeon]
MTELISEGEDIFLYLDRKRTYLVRVEAEKSFHTHKGYIQLGDLIGKEYGTRIVSSMGTEFVALKPTLRDHIFKTSRRTQISYPKDISLIIMYSGIGTGSRVVEAGTGTGALTSAIAHYIRPAGRVYTYELRQEFQKNAKKNLERAGLLDYVELKEGDITAGIEEKDVDAVVLDMATPWLVVPHAYTALKGSGVLVSFSPTIDQVVKVVEALAEHGFVGAETVETLIRFMQVERGKTRPQTVMTGHTGYITFARKAVRLEQYS